MNQFPCRLTKALRFPQSFLLAIGISFTAAAAESVEIIAHRGASWDAPENTMPAFKLAWEQGADAVELDIHASKDGKIVTIHDASTKRIGGVNKAVNSQTFAELRKLDMGGWKGKEWKGEAIPVFEDVLATIPDGKRMFIEIKVGPEILPELERAINASGKEAGQLVIISFRYDTMEESKKRFPKLQHYWVQGYKRNNQTGEYPRIEELIALARAANLDGLNLNHNFPVNREFTQKVKAAGLGLYVWTVNDARIARQWVDAGVDGITTDRPAWLREQLR